jgi:hypothetical protein
MSVDVFRIPKDTFEEFFLIKKVPGDQDCIFHAMATAMNMYGNRLANDQAHHEFERMCKIDSEYHVLKLRKAAFDIICDTHKDAYKSAFVPSITEDQDGECTSIEYFCGNIKTLGRAGGVQGNGAVLNALSKMYDIDMYVAILRNDNKFNELTKSLEVHGEYSLILQYISLATPKPTLFLLYTPGENLDGVRIDGHYDALIPRLPTTKSSSSDSAFKLFLDSLRKYAHRPLSAGGRARNLECC